MQLCCFYFFISLKNYTLTSTGKCLEGQGGEYSDCHRKETVAESDGGVAPDAPVPSGRWQGGKRSIGGVEGVIHNVGGLL